MAHLECLSELIGLRGGCEDISSNATTYLDTKVTYNELNDFVDQNDVAHNTVAKLFESFRNQAAAELVTDVNEHLSSRYVAKTVVKQQELGDMGTALTASPATALLKGIRLQQYTSYPSYNFRINRIGFIGSYTGNVIVTYYDGVTGESLATDTIIAISGQRVELSVNRQFRREVLTIVYDATAIGGYKTTIQGGAGSCYTCRTAGKNKVNGYCYGQGMTAPIGTPLTPTYLNDMGGLSVWLSIECDHESWLCNIKQQLAIPMLYKTAELAMEYGVHNTSRENTSTVRDRGELKDRQIMYHEVYNDKMSKALKAIVLPNDSDCFVCQRRNRIAVSIP